MQSEIDLSNFRAGTVVDLKSDRHYGAKFGIITSSEASESAVLRIENGKIVISSLEQHISLEMRMFGNKLDIQPAWSLEFHHTYIKLGDQIFFVDYTSFRYDLYEVRLTRAIWKEEEVGKEQKGNTQGDRET